MSAGETLLAVRGLGVAYGGIRAVRDVSFDVRRGEIVTLIGGNGAGKSSILRAISGLVPRAGTVRLRGPGPARVPAHRDRRARDRPRPGGPGDLRQPHRGGEPAPRHLAAALGPGQEPARAEIAADLERVFALFPRLAERLRQPGGTLSGGEQQMLAVGRALMCRPRLLLLDEPSMGLAPLLVREIFRVLGEINAAGTTILLVEQNAHMALRVAHRAHVLETGAIVRSGTGAELLGDPAVRDAYLGG